MRLLLCVGTVVLALLANYESSFGQQAPSGQPPSNPAPQPEKPQPPKPTTDQQNNPPARPQRTFEAPRIYRVEGKILMAGGGPPPERVTVLAVCAGQTLAKVWSDSKGNFSLQLNGGISSGAVDASLARLPVTDGSGGPGPSSIHPATDCDLVALLAGFQAQPFRLGPVQSIVTTNYVRLILNPVENVSGYTFSGTTLMASKEARKAHEKGREALSKNRLPEAARELRRAVELHPKFAVAWYDLGRALLKAGQVEEGRRALHAAVDADDKYINPYPVLAQLAFDEKKWEDLARHTATVIRLNPFFSENIYVFSAQANLVLSRLDLAELHVREALKMDREHRLPVAHRILGRILAKQGNSQGAIEQLQVYLQYVQAGPDADQVRAEIASLQQQVSQR